MIDNISNEFQRRKFKCIDPVGLHARPATVFVNLATKFGCDIDLVKGERHVNAKSIMGVLSLGVGEGNEFEVWCQGLDYETAIVEIEKLFLDQKIAELLEPAEVKEDNRVDASYVYLKDFSNEEFVDVIVKVCKKFAEEKGLDLNEIKEKL